MTNQSLSITRIDDLREIRDEIAQWNALAEGVPFRRWEWLGAWWNCFHEGHELFVIAARDNQDRLIGAAPLMSQTSITSGRVLRLLGSGKACTDYLTVMAAPGRENDVVDGIAAWLHEAAADPANQWDLLELENVPVHDARWNRLIEQLRTRGSNVNLRAALHCWWIPQLNDWEGYLRRLSKSHRKQARRILKRDLTESHLEVRRADNSTFELGWESLVDLHQRRWRSRNVDGCFSNQAFARFLHDAAEQFLVDDRLDLHWLEDDGKPVAAQIDFIGEAGAFSYQAGIDPEITSYGPGQLLQTAVLKHAADNNFERYDFLRGDEGYKAHWRAEPTVCYTTRVTPPKAISRLRSGAWSAGQTLKAWIKSGLGMNESSPETSA